MGERKGRGGGEEVEASTNIAGIYHTTHVAEDKQGCVWDRRKYKEVDGRVEKDHTEPNHIVQVGAGETYQPVGGR